MSANPTSLVWTFYAKKKALDKWIEVGQSKYVSEAAAEAELRSIVPANLHFFKMTKGRTARVFDTSPIPQ